ncbi:MAG: adenylate/guanylate cyclase domain-containing protein [Aeromicrobium sp.]|uniref:adenylate/guanylate cyclase domain-containing protein n=1 Tax=Aeromicrobium sp. TaxID=1871063 RepID=UPI0039E5A6E8
MARTGDAAYGSLLLGSADQGLRRLRVRVQVLLTVLIIATNVIGAMVVAALSLVVIPGEGINARFGTALAIATPTYVLAAVVFGATYGTLSLFKSLRWAVRERTPTEAEGREALRLPWRLSLMQACLWDLAAVLYGVLAFLLQPRAVLGVIAGVVIAGLVVTTIAYLFAEFALRPVTARALEEHDVEKIRGVGVQWRLLVFWGLGTAAPVLGLVVAAVMVLAFPESSKTQFAIVVLGLSGVVLAFGLLVTVLTTRSIINPLQSVTAALGQVRDGDYDTRIVVYDGTELGVLQAGFNDMAAGLRERETIRDMFGRHVGREVAAAAQAGEVELGGETRRVSVLFVDLVSSTTYATEHTPADVVAVLNRFFGVVVEEVDRHHGLVNKFMGDAVLAIFGAPVDRPDHAEQALAAARTMARRLAAEVTEVGAGIGVATGEVVAGNIGDESRFEYTVIGDAVNSASRLTDLAKDVPGQVLVMQASVDAASEAEQSHWTPAAPVTLRGRSTPTPVAVLAIP